MAYIKCNACPSPGDCEEAGRCLNTFVTHSHILRHKDGSVAGVMRPETTFGPAPVAQPSPSPAKAPPSAPRAPGQGSVTEQIFAACDAVFAQMNKATGNPAELSATVREAMLKEARQQAIPQLVQAGVNINSARKGSSMWIQARA